MTTRWFPIPCPKISRLEKNHRKGSRRRIRLPGEESGQEAVNFSCPGGCSLGHHSLELPDAIPWRPSAPISWVIFQLHYVCLFIFLWHLNPLLPLGSAGIRAMPVGG